MAALVCSAERDSPATEVTKSIRPFDGRSLGQPLEYVLDDDVLHLMFLYCHFTGSIAVGVISTTVSWSSPISSVLLFSLRKMLR